MHDAADAKGAVPQCPVLQRHPMLVEVSGEALELMHVAQVLACAHVAHSL